MPLQPESLLLGRYRIHAELARGGMGAVYRAHDENLNIEVAIKENLIVAPEFERQFRREASLLAGLRHPNLPRVTDHFVIEGQGQYLVMDFIAGDDVRQRLERQGGPLAEADVVRWGREVLDALSYLHSLTLPIVHRDIKPGNVKITPEGRAVLVDFGLAKVHDVASSTTVGAKALTPGFAPPEQYGLGRTDPRTDLYSLAATMYAMLTNHIPADSFERAMGQKQLIPIRQLNPRVSPSVAEAIEHALAVKPDERFISAAAFAAALMGAPVAQPALPPTPTVPAPGSAKTIVALRAEPITTPAKRGMSWVVPVVILLVFLAVGAGGVGLWAGGVFNGPKPTATLLVVIEARNSPTAAKTDTPAPVIPSATPPPVVIANTDTPAPTSAPTDTPTPTEIPATPTPDVTPVGGGAHGQIAFASNRNGLPQIYIMNADGSNQVALTNNPDGACQPAWSPDGTRLLYVSPCTRKTEAYPNAAIFIITVEDTAQGPVGKDSQPFITKLGGSYDPDWSETGIAFTYSGGDRPQIWLTDANGRSAQVLSAARATDKQPSWSQGGARIAFTNATRTGRAAVYWMNKDGSFDGTNPNAISRETAPCSGEADSPAWSPEGSYVAYVVNDQICVVKWDAFGFGPILLTGKGPNAHPDWSPDSQWIVFESWRDAAEHDIYIMNATGGAVTRLTNNGGFAEFQPAWRP